MMLWLNTERCKQVAYYFLSVCLCETYQIACTYREFTSLLLCVYLGVHQPLRALYRILLANEEDQHMGNVLIVFT